MLTLGLDSNWTPFHYNSGEMNTQFEGALSRRLRGIRTTALPALKWRVA